MKVKHINHLLLLQDTSRPQALQLLHSDFCLLNTGLFGKGAFSQIKKIPVFVRKLGGERVSFINEERAQYRASFFLAVRGKSQRSPCVGIATAQDCQFYLLIFAESPLSDNSTEVNSEDKIKCLQNVCIKNCNNSILTAETK